jgi:uncharacterized membrane protein
MTIDPELWPKLHGAMTHFTVALSFASVLFDAAAFVFPGSNRSRGLHLAGFYTLEIGALGSFGAVFTGLIMTNWSLLGHGALGAHHAFVWPAFALLIELALWRLFVRESASRRAFGLYLVLAVVLLGLMGGAGATGGEMLLKG